MNTDETQRKQDTEWVRDAPARFPSVLRSPLRARTTALTTVTAITPRPTRHPGSNAIVSFLFLLPFPPSSLLAPFFIFLRRLSSTHATHLGRVVSVVDRPLLAVVVGGERSVSDACPEGMGQDKERVGNLVSFFFFWSFLHIKESVQKRFHS